MLCLKLGYIGKFFPTSYDLVTTSWVVCKPQKKSNNEITVNRNGKRLEELNQTSDLISYYKYWYVDHNQLTH